MLSLQGFAFLVLLALGCVPGVRRLLTPPAVRRALAWRLAAEQFVVRGLARTADRSGILIFVSQAERYARIIADEGIARHVPQAQWQAAVDALVAHMRQDRPADGFIAAIAICSEVLARHFPGGGRPHNALPDRIYQI
jgi:putative membrane protein